MYKRILVLCLAHLLFVQIQGQSITLSGSIKNAFTHQAIPDVTVTLMRADSTIIQDSLMVMPLDGYTLWVKSDMPRVPQKLIVRVVHPDFETTFMPYYGPCPRSKDEMLRHNGFINCNIESPDDY